MKLGDLTVNIVSDGRFKLDGGAMFGLVPKLLWERKVKADRRNRVTLGLNCLLIQSPETTILVDTGIGTKESDGVKDRYGLTSSRLLRSLKSHGVSPRDVNMVVLTHLHFDHCGGNTRLNRNGDLVPTFPRATYIVQRECWEDANAPSERNKASFHPDNFQPLIEQDQLRILEGDTELIPGVWVRATGGHARGHQIVTVESEAGKLAFLGDLIPTVHHLPLPYVSSFDFSPDESVERKRKLLDLITKDGWIAIFSHDAENQAGYLSKRNGNTFFRAVTL
jgi:glyoxylase-like metal-dependent hydrolase (beta-lactamase superfamily II)